MTFSLATEITILVIADLLPVLAVIICMWINSKGHVDYLVSGYLQAPNEDDRTTFVGSHMLSEFKNELGASDDKPLVESTDHSGSLNRE